jgi:hypothetical protein
MEKIMNSRIKKKVNDEINNIEENIRILGRKCYNLPEIGIAIEILEDGQNEFRPLPCNRLCQKRFEKPSSRITCDESDKIMKRLLLEEVNNEHHISIGYLCHQGLSNIIMPFHDNICTNSEWYIFLGQFALTKGHTEIFNDAQIGILGENVDLPREYKRFVKKGFFCENIGKKYFETVPVLNIANVLQYGAIARCYWQQALDHWKDDTEMKNILQRYITLFRKNDIKPMGPELSAAYTS